MFQKRKKRKKTKKYSHTFNFKKFYMMAVFLIIIALVFSGLSLFNQRLIPAVTRIVNMDTQTNINKLINDSLQQITASLNLSSSDFYVKSVDKDGKINSFSANTMLINEICAQLAVDISEKLSQSSVQKVSLPIGSLLGIEIFANSGPNYSVKILPKGNANVDYETEFLAAGINQINFQIWLIINSRVQIVNPLQDEEIILTRKIALVNTVINGEVPPAYIGLPE